MGMMIADKQEGSFQVVIKSMRPMRHGPKTRIAKEVKPSIVAAIERGVPVFNKGDAQGCATSTAIRWRCSCWKGRSAKEPWAAQMVDQALEKSQKQTSFEAAWTLRWAMDRMMLGLSGDLLPASLSNRKVPSDCPHCRQGYALQLGLYR